MRTKLTAPEQERVRDLLDELDETEKFIKEMKRNIQHIEEELREAYVEQRFILRSLERYGVEIDRG